MSSQTSSGGIGFIGLLQIVFIVLKLIGKIDWSWWWVMAPTWGSFLFYLAVASAILAYYIIKAVRR